MEIYTSSWHGYRGNGRIGISRGAPRFSVGKGYRFYRKLAPTREILAEAKGYAEYRKRFLAEVLAPLDPEVVLTELQALAGPYTPVLLCFEKPPLDKINFCHRTMVAEWLNEHTKANVVEWSGVEELNPEQAKLDV